MLKFIRGKGQQPTAERQKLQKDLFAFRKVLHLQVLYLYVYLQGRHFKKNIGIIPFPTQPKKYAIQFILPYWNYFILTFLG